MGGETSADTPVYDDNVNPSEILTTDDLLSFAWQVSSGMVRMFCYVLFYRHLLFT